MFEQCVVEDNIENICITCAIFVQMNDLVRTFRLFVRLAEQPSFSAVARHVGQSHTTVARSIGELEAHFGVLLFQRSTRRLALTRDGERLLAHATTIIEQVDQAEAELAGTVAARGLVRVGITTALGLHYAERLGELRAAHPHLSIDFIIADWRNDAADPGLDLRVRIDEVEGEGLRKLGDTPRLLVAAPAYLATRGVPRTASDLTDHDCITYGYEARPTPWEIGDQRLHVTGYLRTNSSEAALRAVRGGLGIGLLPQIQVGEDIARGLLIPLLPGTTIPPVPVSVAHPFIGMRMPVRVHVVLEFLASAFPDADSMAQSAARALA
jgi:DNA-binding transcriptional LysR family regulator